MTTFWPKRDEYGRHVTDDKGHRGVIGESGGSETQAQKDGNYTFNRVTGKWMHEDDFTPCKKCHGDGFHKDFRVEHMVKMMICTLCEGSCCE